MSRLIDADALIEAINKSTCNWAELLWKQVVYDVISNQPTAYDTERVVEELEHFAKLAEDRWVNGTSNHAYQEHKCWVKAIDIVKRGVQNERIY